MSSLRCCFCHGARTAPSPFGVRFLIDNALPPKLAALLRAAGHDAIHLRECGIQAAKDESVLARAVDEDRIIVSADTDFGTLSAGLEAHRPSFILFRDPDLLTADDYAGVPIPSLPALEPELTSGCVAVFRAGRLRVRKLPISPA